MPTSNDIDESNGFQNDLEPVKRTRLPKLQLFVVFLIQFTEPITACVILPFITQFVRDTGITNGDEKKTGHYAGVIESVFFLAESLTVFSWGRASDYFGRRPILLLGPIGLGLALMSFGLSTHYWGLVASRCFQGIFNGNIGVAKSLMAEITDASNIADAFAMISFVWGVGSTLGPILGGVFARPAERWPDTLGKIEFFSEYPYFLPCALAAFIAFFSAMIAFLSLKETLPSAIRRKKERALGKNRAPPSNSESDCNPTSSLLARERPTSYGTTDNSESTSADIEEVPISGPEAAEAPPPLRDLMVPRILIPLVNIGFLAFSDMSYQVLIPLVWSTSISLGGLGLSPYQIGRTMGIWGVLNAFVQIFCFGPLTRRFGARNVYIACYASLIIGLGAYPVENWLAMRAGKVDAFVWIAITIQLIASSGTYMAYGSIGIFVIDSAPSQSAMGATNGLAQAVESVMRSTAPSFSSSLFAISLGKQWLGGRMVYLLLLGFTFIGLRLSLLLPRELRLK